MVLSKFDVLVQQFDPEAKPEYKSYTFGLFFQASFIDKQIELIEEMFYRIFTTRFVVPFVVGAILFILVEVL